MAATVEINIVNSRFINNWDPFISSNRFEHIKRQHPDLKCINLNFVRGSFMEPFHIVSLACLIEEYYLNKIVVSITNINDSTLKKYLEDINFLNYWKSNSGYLPSERKTALGLWKISLEMIDAYAREAKEYFERNYIENKDLMPLSTALSELFMNIFDHSKSPVSGFCLTQYYPNLKKIKFSVCDFGVGIPNSINAYLAQKGDRELTDIDCLLKAFEFKFTTQSTPRNRGFGLDTIKSIIKGNKGSLSVVSNKANFKISNADIKATEQQYSFNGTHFELILSIDNLTEKSEETEDFDFEF